MEIRQTLVDISNDARGWLNVWIKDFSDDEATRRVDHDGPNPLAWQLGHLAGVEDDVYQLFSGKPSIVPPALKAHAAPARQRPAAPRRFPPTGAACPARPYPRRPPRAAGERHAVRSRPARAGGEQVLPHSGTVGV